MPAFIDLTGQRFHRLLVLKRADSLSSVGRVQWDCRCDCGNEVVIPGLHLKTGNTKSCGCQRVDSSRANGKARKTHGMTRSPEYRAWQSMKDRCYNEDCENFKNYGARGIVVWHTWMKSFNNFYRDMGPRPGPDYSLDRIDNNGNYTPSNCRWATAEQQANNRRTNYLVELDGEVRTLSQVAKETNIPLPTLATRLKKGLDIKGAIIRKSHRGVKIGPHPEAFS